MNETAVHLGKYLALTIGVSELILKFNDSEFGKTDNNIYSSLFKIYNHSQHERARLCPIADFSEDGALTSRDGPERPLSRNRHPQTCLYWHFR